MIFLDCRVKRTSPLHGSGTFMFSKTSSGSPSFRINSAAERAIRAAFAKFFHACLDAGVYFAPSQFETGFISLAHTGADLERTAEIVATALRA